MHFSGTVWRHVPGDAHPLHIGRILNAFGRWNRPGQFGCLYTALTVNGARAEYYKHFKSVGSNQETRARRDLVSIIVDVEPVLNLTDVDIQKQLGFNKEEILGDTEESVELCRSIATWGREQGYRAILAPSAAASNEKNLVVYIEGPANKLRLEVGKDRIPLVP